jgi:hypothetical protein
VADAKKGGKGEAYTGERLQAMLDFFQAMTTWHQEMCKLPRVLLQKVVRLGGRVGKLIA